MKLHLGSSRFLSFTKYLFFLTVLISAGVRAETSNPSSFEKSPRSLVHLLNYLASDYAGAVKDGKILVASEYEEQLEFIGLAEKIAESLKASDKQSYQPILSKVDSLKKLIESKAQPADVSKLALGIKADIIQISHLPVSPESWPSLTGGKKVFEANCSTCHGADEHGDGPAAATLNPKPRNFHDDKMNELSAFHIFNVARLGIPGTGMPAFAQLSDKDAWDVAFYVLSLRYQNSKNTALTKSLSTLPNLEEVASLSDEELEQKIPGQSEKEKKQKLAALRLESSDHSDGSSLRVAESDLNTALERYQKGDLAGAKQLAVQAYLDGVEPVEPQLKATDFSVPHLESLMAQVRSDFSFRRPLGIVKISVSMAQTELQKAESALSKSESSPWITFSLAAGIMFREGFEAVLIILAVLGVVRAASARRAASFVHGGWVAAVLLGALCWAFSGWVLMVSGAQRELSEGLASLFAVAVLLYMGFWLHSKTEIKKWTAFIDGKVKRALEGSSRWGLFVLAFIAVFREALETVLFMRALLLQGGESSEKYLFAGVVSSFVAVILLAWALLRFSVRIPIRQLFGISSWVMVVLSVILIGKGFHSFQETGILSVTAVSVPFNLPFFGIYPTMETLAAQMGVFVLCLFIWTYGPSIFVKERIRS